MLLRIICIALLELLRIEARVYCGDPNANAITYVGRSCAVKCANVKAAVEQLKVVDYHRLLKEDRERLQSRLEDSDSFLPYPLKRTSKQNRTINETVKNATRRLFLEYSKVLTDDKTIKYLQKELKHFALLKKLNKLFCRRNDSYNSLYDQCIRRSPYEDDFVRRLTRFLNGYAKSQFQFTKSMVVLLLRKIFGNNIDLRQGELVMPKIVEFLRQAMERSLAEATIVHLSPRHCLGIFVPGCYCKEGFLEQTGKCITLESCLADGSKDLSNYLTRVVIH